MDHYLGKMGMKYLTYYICGNIISLVIAGATSHRNECNKMIGIEFEIHNTNNNSVLYDLLKGIDFNEYIWYFAQKEMFDKNYKKSPLNELVKGEILEKTLKFNQIFIIECNLQVFSKEDKIIDIKDYETFNKSDCSLIILIYDTKEVEIYFKNNKLKKIVLSNLKKMGIDYLKKTKKNDYRTIMRV